MEAGVAPPETGERGSGLCISGVVDFFVCGTVKKFDGTIVPA